LPLQPGLAAHVHAEMVGNLFAMRAVAVRFLSVMFAALALVPTMAHLFELPNKIGLPRDEYLIVQQIYRGWALAGILVLGALLSTLALTIISRGNAAASSSRSLLSSASSERRSCFGFSHTRRINRRTTGLSFRRTGRDCGHSGSTLTRQAQS